MSEERLKILEMISSGAISAEQGAQLIQALDETVDEVKEFENSSLEVSSKDHEPQPVEQNVGAAIPAAYGEGGPAEDGAAPAATDENNPGAAPKTPSGFNKWRSYWYLPLGIGVVITAVSGLLVYAGNQGSWHWFWMACVWMPLLLGIVIMVFSAMSSQSRWVHVRVNTGQDEWPRRIAISLPLPLRTAAWAMRIFGRFIPGLDDIPIPIDEVIVALDRSLTPDDPLYVEVHDSGGEHVEVYIG